MMAEEPEDGVQAEGADVEGPGNADSPENASKPTEAGPPSWHPWIFGPAAAVLAAFLVDAAVETAIAESPLRWWVIGAVGLALACVGLLWKRIIWPTRAALLLLLVLAGLAGAAWSPAGLDRGVVALGQSTSVLLAGATALLLAAAGTGVLLQRFLHPAARVLLALLAAYGIAAFGFAVRAQTAWAELFHGAAFFEGAPFYLQGAVVGALGVLPAFVLVELVRGALRVRGRAFRLWAVQLLAIGCGVALALAGLFGYRLDVVLTASLDESGEPAGAVDSIAEDAAAIHVVFRSSLGSSVKIDARWIAEQTLELEPGASVAESSLTLAPGKLHSLSLKASSAGFSPGRYRLELDVDGDPRDPLYFDVVALLPSLALLEDADVSRGFNLARDVLGGRIVRASSEYDDKWSAQRLIDGGVLRAPINSKLERNSSPGWSSQQEDGPFDLVFAFHGDREALIGSVILDPTTPNSLGKPQYLPKHLELWVSRTDREDDFTKVSEGRMRRVAAQQVIEFEPVRASRVMLRILSSHGADSVQLGEVKVLEDASQGSSILDDFERNLALPWLGGAIVRMSSQSANAAYLIDGAETEGGWKSSDGYLPQEIVFAFEGDREAFVDRVVLVPSVGDDPQTWPRSFTLSVSSDSPLDGFDEVGNFEFSTQGGAQSYRVARPARFVKLRILENHGGSYTTLREVRLLEGAVAQQDSVLFDPPLEEGDWRRRGEAGEGVAGPDADLESEPNDDPSRANPLRFDRFVRGTIEPLGESDYYALDIPDASPVLTLELLGHPYIRTSLALLDAAGAVKKRFDPGARPGADRTLSWRVDPGPHRLHVTEPRISLVLIWDKSGSMGGRTDDLSRAVMAYIEQVQPSEQLHLVNFNQYVNVITPAFTSDRAVLRAAAQGNFGSQGGTAFYEAIGRGIQLLEEVTGNKAIVVMTDGADSSSHQAYPGFWRMLEEKRIRIYTIGLGEGLEEYPLALGNTPRRMLSHVALGTNGRSFFAHSSDELSGVYQQIADELRALSTYHLRPHVSPGPGTLEVVATGERIAKVSTPLFELILDASGSMRERKRKVNGRLKMEVAKDIAIQTVEGLPDDATVAFRVYGRRIREGRRGDCQDSELVFPFGRVDKPRLIKLIQGIKALGTTPLAYSLQQAARDFGDASGAKVLILVTDGKEECGGSPTQVVEELTAAGFEFTVNVVGFALAEEAVKLEMERVAEITGGRFFDAQDAEGLRDAIRASLAVPYEVLDSEGERVARGLTGRSAVEVPEGVYTVVMRTAGDPVVIEDVPVRRGEPTRVEVKKEGEEVGVRVLTKPEPVPPPPEEPRSEPQPQSESQSESSDSGTGSRTGVPENGSTSVNEEEASGTTNAISPPAG